MDYADVEFLFSMQLGRGFAYIHILRVGYINITTPWVCPHIFGRCTANCVFKLAIYGGETPNLLVLIIRSDQKNLSKSDKETLAI